MSSTQTQVAPAPTLPLAMAEDPPLPPPPAPEDLPPPPPRESFSKFHQQRQASELRRLYRHIHPELRKNLAEAVAEDLAEVLGSEEPTEGDVQCMRWIFENWRLDAIGDHERPAAAREPVPSGDVQATSRRFEEGAFASSPDHEPAAGPPPPSGADVRAARRLFETTPLAELTGQAEATPPPEATAKEPAASGDVQGTRMLFETRPLDRLGSRPSVQEPSPLELRSEVQELRGDVKKTVRLFQTQPLCAIQDAQGAIHEVKAACREEIQSQAVRTARWLFETQPLDAINRDPGQVRVIRGISLEEEGTRPDVSATRWIFETQPLDAIREILVDEKDFQPSPDLLPPGPDVRQQRLLFETRALDTLKGEEEEGAAEAPPKEEVVPGDVRSTLWLFETQPLDTARDRVHVGHLQRVGPGQGEGLLGAHLSGDSFSALSLPPSASPKDGVKGDVKTFKNLFETLPLDSIGQGEPSTPGHVSGVEGADSAGESQVMGSPVYALQDGKGHLHALTSVSREQVVGGDVQGYRWMFETQPLDRLGRSPSTVDVVRGITRQEVAAGDVSTARWLFETQPLEVIHQRERQERQQEEEGRGQAGSPPEAPPKGDVQTLRWLFETCPMSELAEKQGSEVADPTAQAEARSCTWMFVPQAPDGPEGSRDQHLQVCQVPAGEGQTDRHVFETEPLRASGRPGGRGPVRYCSRVEIPSGQVSRQKEVFQALDAGGREGQGSRAAPEPIPVGSVQKFTWLFENCPMGSLAAESIRGGDLQEEQPGGLAGSVPQRQETATQGTLRTLHATPGILRRGGILMEARGPGELCLAKYVLPGPGQGAPHVQKEELVCGELPRIVCQVLSRPDVDRQGLLVQEDAAGQLRLKPMRLPGGSGSIEDLDLEFQQLLACGLGTSVARTGLVMQETEQGLVSLTAYSLQPWLASRAPERSSVQLLASCIDKGDLSGLHSLRWEPPVDPGPEPAGEEAQRLPATESIIHVPPLDPSMEIGHLRGPGATPCPPRTIAKRSLLVGKEEQEDRCPGQTGTEALGKPAGDSTASPGPRAADLQAAMQSLRMATAEAPNLPRQVLDQHKQGPAPGAVPKPCQGGLPQAPAAAPGTAQSNNTRPVAGGDPRMPAAPRKVSGEQTGLPTGLPGGRETIQDGLYTAHPVRTSDLPGGVRPSKREHPPPRGRETARLAQASSPLHECPGQSLGQSQEEPGGRTPRARGPPEKAMAGVGAGSLQAAETTPKAASVAPDTLTSAPQAAGAGLHSHNASVPPPLPAAVTGPDSPPPAHHDEDSLLHSRSGPAGQSSPGESPAKTPKAEPTIPPRKKPQLPPKPAHLSQIPPPRRLPKPSALSPSSSEGKSRQGETEAAAPRPAKVPTATGRGHAALAGSSSSGQSQPGPSNTAPGPATTQTTSSNTQRPEPRKLSALNSDPASPRQGPSPPGEKLMEGSQQEAPESSETQQGSQQGLHGLLSQVQALEQEAASSVDVGALRRLFEAVPQLGGSLQAPAAPAKPEASVEQAFGELTRVSMEVARLKEQTLARLLDIEEAVHKALSSMSGLQPEAHPGGDSRGPPEDHSAHQVSGRDSSRARPSCSGEKVGGPSAIKSPTEVPCRIEVQGQAKVKNHTETRGPADTTAPSTRRLETLREDPGLAPVSPSSREAPSSPTFISIKSATRKLLEAPSHGGSPDLSVKSTHVAQAVSQAPLHQKGIRDKAGDQEVTQRSGQPEPTLASASTLPGTRQKTVLELQTGPGGSQRGEAPRTVTEQCREVDQCGNSLLTSSSTATEQAGPAGGPGPHLGLQAYPLLKPFLRSPARMSGDPQPAAQ